MRRYSKEIKALIDELIDDIDVSRLVEDIVSYHTNEPEEVFDRLLRDYIDDWQEFTQDELHYLQDRVNQFVEEFA